MAAEQTSSRITRFLTRDTFVFNIETLVRQFEDHFNLHDFQLPQKDLEVFRKNSKVIGFIRRSALSPEALASVDEWFPFVQKAWKSSSEKEISNIYEYFKCREKVFRKLNNWKDQKKELQLFRDLIKKIPKQTLENQKNQEEISVQETEENLLKLPLSELEDYIQKNINHLLLKDQEAFAGRFNTSKAFIKDKEDFANLVFKKGLNGAINDLTQKITLAESLLQPKLADTALEKEKHGKAHNLADDEVNENNKEPVFVEFYEAEQVAIQDGLLNIMAQSHETIAMIFDRIENRHKLGVHRETYNKEHSPKVKGVRETDFLEELEFFVKIEKNIRESSLRFLTYSREQQAQLAIAFHLSASDEDYVRGFKSIFDEELRSIIQALKECLSNGKNSEREIFNFIKVWRENNPEFELMQTFRSQLEKFFKDERQDYHKYGTKSNYNYLRHYLGSFLSSISSDLLNSREDSVWIKLIKYMANYLSNNLKLNDHELSGCIKNVLNFSSPSVSFLAEMVKHYLALAKVLGSDGGLETSEVKSAEESYDLSMLFDQSLMRQYALKALEDRNHGLFEVLVGHGVSFTTEIRRLNRENSRAYCKKIKNRYLIAVLMEQKEILEKRRQLTLSPTEVETLNKELTEIFKTEKHREVKLIEEEFGRANLTEFFDEVIQLSDVNQEFANKIFAKSVNNYDTKEYLILLDSSSSIELVYKKIESKINELNQQEKRETNRRSNLSNKKMELEKRQKILLSILCDLYHCNRLPGFYHRNYSKFEAEIFNHPLRNLDDLIPEEGSTLFHKAYKAGSQEVEALLLAGANPFVKNSEDETVLHWALQDLKKHSEETSLNHVRGERASALLASPKIRSLSTEIIIKWIKVALERLWVNEIQPLMEGETDALIKIQKTVCGYFRDIAEDLRKNTFLQMITGGIYVEERINDIVDILHCIYIANQHSSSDKENIFIAVKKMIDIHENAKKGPLNGSRLHKKLDPQLKSLNNTLCGSMPTYWQRQRTPETERIKEELEILKKKDQDRDRETQQFKLELDELRAIIRNGGTASILGKDLYSKGSQPSDVRQIVEDVYSGVTNHV